MNNKNGQSIYIAGYSSGLSFLHLKTFKTFRPVFKPSPETGFSFSLEAVPLTLPEIDLVDRVLEELGVFIRTESAKVHIVFDEFQGNKSSEMISRPDLTA